MGKPRTTMGKMARIVQNAIWLEGLKQNGGVFKSPDFEDLSAGGRETLNAPGVSGTANNHRLAKAGNRWETEGDALGWLVHGSALAPAERFMTLREANLVIGDVIIAKSTNLAYWFVSKEDTGINVLPKGSRIVYKCRIGYGDVYRVRREGKRLWQAISVRS